MDRNLTESIIALILDRLTPNRDQEYIQNLVNDFRSTFWHKKGVIESKLCEFIRSYTIMKKNKAVSFSELDKTFDDLLSKQISKMGELRTVGELTYYGRVYKKILKLRKQANFDLLLQEVWMDRVIVDLYPILIKLYGDSKLRSMLDSWIMVWLKIYYVRSLLCFQEPTGIPLVYNNLDMIMDQDSDIKIKEQLTSYLFMDGIAQDNILKHYLIAYKITDRCHSGVIRSILIEINNYLANHKEISEKEALSVDHLIPKNAFDSWHRKLDLAEWTNRTSELEKIGNLTVIPKALNTQLGDTTNWNYKFNRIKEEFDVELSRRLPKVFEYSDIINRGSWLSDIVCKIWSIDLLQEGAKGA